MAARKQTWFGVTTAASERWKAAVGRYHETCYLARRHAPDPEAACRRAHEQAMSARREYRHMIIGWYFKLCTPMQIGECTPNEVATLLAEDWNEKTKHQEIP